MLHDGVSGGHESQEETARADEECCQREAAQRFQTPRAAKCWAMYCAFLANPGVKCPRCWRVTTYCCCAAMPSLKLRPHVIVLFHHEELGQHSATNTAVLLLLLGADQFCCGHPEHDERLQALLREDVAGTAVLFPSADALPAAALAEAAQPPRRIVILDGGWAQCKKMNQWLDPALPRCVVETATREEFGATRRYRGAQSGRVQTASAFAALCRELREDPQDVQAVAQGLSAFMSSFEAQMGPAGRLTVLEQRAGGVALLPVRYDEEKEGSQLPDPVSAGVAIFSLAQPLSFLSMVFYWTVEKPIWAIQSEDLPDYLGFFVHCISWLLTLISLFCSRIPFSCQHGGWVLMFGVAYLVFSFMHYCLKIGLPQGCTGYVQPECPIYEVLDWHKPEDVATVSFLTLGVAFPTAIILYSWMVHLRDSCDGKADLREMDDIIRRQMEALQ
ncbi:unnamed protein product, partial [Symbiodinium necroappetens]